MEDQVSFKVYTYWNESDKPEIRRFGIEKSVVTSFHYLNTKLQEVFPGLKNKHFNVSWKDEEGDDVTMSSDHEVCIALVAMQSQNLIKLFIYCKDPKPHNDKCEVPPGTDKACPNVPTPHCGVVCDGCESPVVGFRYKCTTCHDFDLCSKCEGAGMHPDHCMVRVPMPNVPHSALKVAIKRFDHILKAIEAERNKNQRELNAIRKRLAHAHRQLSGDGDDQQRTRISLLETYAKSLNKFVNLDGKIKIDIVKLDKHQDSKAKADSKNKGTSGDPKKKDTAADPIKKKKSKAHQKQCPLGKNMNVQMIEKMLGAFLGSDLIKSSTSGTNTQSEPQEPVNIDVVMDQGDIAVPNDKESMQSQPNREPTPETEKNKVDGWTVINKEKDLQDTNTKADLNKAPAIGFNLPKEFQARVNISVPKNIYPSLNVSTAVLNPKEVEKTTTTTQSQAAGKSQASNTATPSAPAGDKKSRKHHPLAHIDVALEQMIGMGFTNEGGWLTKLLENKNGNVVAVLDLLTPVNSKK